MADYPCNFTIPASGNGQLTGSGLGSGPPPLMTTSDTLTVKVQWAGIPANAPASLTGYFLFSPASGSNQTAPSPFMSGTNYVCVAVRSANQSAGPPVTYTFQSFTYAGGLPGRYELTFVAEANTGNTTNLVQWSADPEFDTSN